jgi:hypothetical protein
MKIYVKELGKEESIQILNTTTDNFSMPRVGDTILGSYVVSNVEWTSFKGRNGSAILWVVKKEDNLIKVSIIKAKNSLWKTKTRESEVIMAERNIEKTKLTGALIPRVGDKIEVEGIEGMLEVIEVIRLGDLFDLSEIKIIVNELS